MLWSRIQNAAGREGGDNQLSGVQDLSRPIGLAEDTGAEGQRFDSSLNHIISSQGYVACWEVSAVM